MLEVYVKDGCPYCEKQIQEFKSKGIEYKLFNLSVDPEALEKARSVFKADKVPLVVDEETVKSIGFNGGG